MLHLKCLFCYIENDLFAALAAAAAVCVLSLFVLCIFTIFSLHFHANNSKLTVKIRISKSGIFKLLFNFSNPTRKDYYYGYVCAQCIASAKTSLQLNAHNQRWYPVLDWTIGINWFIGHNYEHFLFFGRNDLHWCSAKILVFRKWNRISSKIETKTTKLCAVLFPNVRPNVGPNIIKSSVFIFNQCIVFIEENHP